MKSAVDQLDPTRVKIAIEVPYAELKPSLDQAYASIGQQIQIPGFRKGKVPARIIDQRVGRGAVLQEAINEALPEFFGKAVEENDLQPIGQPEVDITQVPDAEGDELKFSVEVDVRPEVTLPDFSGIAVEVEPVEITDADLDEALSTLRERFGTLVGVERAATKGDFVSIDLTATVGDEEVDSVNGVSYEIGSGNMLEGLDEALEGLKAGESATFTAPLAGGEHEGEDAQCSVTVESVKERELPELDDEFAQLASEHDTIDELKDEVRGQVEQNKKLQQGIEARDKVLDKMLEIVEIPVPESVVKAEVDQHLEGENRLDDDEHRAEVDTSTRQALKTQFLLDEIVSAENVEVSQQELIEYLIMSAQQYGMDPNQFAQALDAQGQVPAVMGEVARRKALSTVLEKVTVTDTTGATVDLSELDDEVEVEAGDEAEGTEAEVEVVEAIEENDDAEAKA
ncbi:trigger factor [Dermacoccaceae bacterium W4C1]